MSTLFYRTCNADADLSGVYRRLPEGKRAALRRLRRPADLVRSLTAYGLLGDALSQSTDRPPPLSDLAWSTTGRPFFPRRPGLFFGLAHSGDLAVCALGPTRVGVDVEPTDASAADYAALAEAMGFAPCASAGDFLRTWVLWESYLKFTDRALPPRGLWAEGKGEFLALVNDGRTLPARLYLRPVERALAALCVSPAETAAPVVRHLPSV